MQVERVKEMPTRDRMLYWIRERYQIFLNRKAGLPKPWTDDEILQSYRFCNVRRMDDTVSQWLLKNWYEPYKDHPNVVIACVLARHFNLPDALATIKFPTVWEPGELKKVLRERKQRGLPNFNGAYIIRADEKYPDKATMVVDETVQQFVDRPPRLDTSSMQRCVETLATYRNMGSFMSGQVIADLRWAMSGRWKDRLRWAPMGPGSKRGMNRFHERPVDSPLSQSQFEVELGDFIGLCKETLPPSMTDRLEAMDYQNCFCEFDKYERVLHGEGRPKSKYNGTGW